MPAWTVVPFAAVRLAGQALLLAVLLCVGEGFAAEADPQAGAASPAPSPQLRAGQPVDWWFVFKFNSKSFPGCADAAKSLCSFGGKPSAKLLSQQFVYASSANHALQAGGSCLGDSERDPVGSTFSELFNGSYHYVVWSDQFYRDPKITGCGDACARPWGHSKGMIAWNDAGEGVVMQVSTPSWPGAGSKLNNRHGDANTLGCIESTNNVLVSQSFFAVRLGRNDVTLVLQALANASVATDPANLQIVSNGGPQQIRDLVTVLGKPSPSTTPMKVSLSSGIVLLSKPSALHVPPWQLVSAELGSAPLRVASWWTHPAIDSTAASTPVDCWAPGLPRPGAVEVATSGSWQGTKFGLKGGPGPDFNHAKVGVSTGGGHHYVIFGDMNQQGTLSDTDCARSQNGRGGLFFILDDAPLAASVSSLISGAAAPIAGARP